METNATEKTILKYYNVLKELHQLLNLTNNISMLKFSQQKEISRNLSTVLKDGGIIKLEGSRKHSKWYWVSSEPTREMAIETIKRLSSKNPSRVKKEKKVKTKENVIDYITFKILWIEVKVKINYKK